jgi:hypothetical protein
LLAAFQAKQTEEICWTEIKVGDLLVTVAEDAMKAPLGGRAGVRLPVSYAEAMAICRELECVAPTQEIADAMFAQAKAQLNFVPLVRTAADSAKMTTVDFTLRFNDGVEKQLSTCDRSAGGLIAGAWKHWLLHPRVVERGAVNYGFWDKSKKPPKPIQSPGGQHDAAHYDYSQLLQPVKRMARRAATGEEVDLLDYIASHDRVPAPHLQRFRREVTGLELAAFQEPGDVDLLEVLTGAGVCVEAAEGWSTRGRPGFEPRGIMIHHTATPGKADAPTLGVCLNGRPDLKGPLCHILLSRSGKAHLLAANIANHAGKGAVEVLELLTRDEPVLGNARDNGYRDTTSGNAFFYGIEVENAGTKGEPYPEAQIEALTSICAALCSAHGWSASRVVHHRQWTSRKIDMSFRGDIPGLVAQKMDTGSIYFSVAEEGSEPMWEPDDETGRTSPGDEE